MAGAAGGFVTRAFEAMLKECASNKKNALLQQSIQSYLGAPLFISLSYILHQMANK
jgi:guanine nucleotide-exchange factor